MLSVPGKWIRYPLIVLTVFIFGISQSYGRTVIRFGPGETKIVGSIRYTVLGQYVAQFGVFKGRIILNENTKRMESVYLDIDAKSIHSKSPWCDKQAKSRRLLFTARYPKIVFESDQVIWDHGGYKVKGVLKMHGVSRRMSFPFKERILIDPKTGRRAIEIKGDWEINRKDFNITWNKYLDHGGVLVSDLFKVSWKIKVFNPS